MVIADGLAEAARHAPELNLVLVLRAAPEEVAFKDEIGLSARMGEHLQSECLERTADAFGDRCAVLSPVRPMHSHSGGRDQLHNAPIIYVHTEIAIADADRAIVGSAKLNGRSMM